MIRFACVTFLMFACAGFQANARDLTDKEKDVIRNAVGAGLKDPGSAQYEFLPFVGQKVYCGRVNAKNSYGGYVGFVPFSTDLTVRDGEIVAAGESYVSPPRQFDDVLWRVCQREAGETPK